MRNLTIAYFLLGFVLLLGACRSDHDQPDPKPTHTVKIRVTGTDVTGLGAEFHYYIKPPEKMQDHILAAVVPDNGMAEYTPGSWEPTTEAILVVAFSKVERTSTIQPRAGSTLTGEVLIDGQVKATVILDKNTPLGPAGYVSNYTRVLLGE